MAQIYRNFLSGVTTDNPLLIGATSFNSTALAALPVIAAPDVMYVTLDPEGVDGAPEIVTITAHSSSATSATITRAAQSTTARQHLVGTAWSVAPTQADMDELPFRKMTAKGDLIVATAANTATRKAVGSDGYPLVARASDSTGVAYEQLSTTGIADSAITSVKIADGTIATADLADGAVTSAKIANGTIVTDDLADSSVTAAKIAAGAITAADFSGEAWTPYTPTWSNLTVGNGTVVAKYIQYGKLVFVEVTFSLGSTSSVSSAPTMSLPVAASSYVYLDAVPVHYYDNTGLRHYGHLVGNSSTTVGLLASTAAGAYVTAVVVDSTTPFTWAVSDRIRTAFFYEAA
jgi:hypothetical protein